MSPADLASYFRPAQYGADGRYLDIQEAWHRAGQSFKYGAVTGFNRNDRDDQCHAALVDSQRYLDGYVAGLMARYLVDGNPS